MAKESIGLGTAISKVTSAVGVKPCGGCKKRAEKLDNLFGRRGFLGGALFSSLLLKDSIVRAAWRVVGAEPTVPNWAALGFVRTANAMQLANYLATGARHDRIGMLVAVTSHREHFSQDHPGYAWMSLFRPAAQEILPGWTLDISSSKGKYIFALRSESITFVTDEHGGIYSAPTPVNPPDLSKLSGAHEYPGAAADWAHVEAPRSIVARIKNFFTPGTVYALGCCPDCSSSRDCYNCGCPTCLANCSNCCNSNLCQDGPPTTASCSFNVGCLSVACKWYNDGCGSDSCNCCAKLFATCCVKLAGCTAACAPCGLL